MSRVFSAIQPTGFLHLGNYLGALKQFSELQEKYNECFYCIADLHAITVNQCPKKLQENILFTIASYIASGINPEKSTLFIQSSIAEHLELSWILTCNTPIGWLTRMTQFKDKVGIQNNQTTMTGLFVYPCLMAADILLYKSNFVPIGNDQIQHLEITCDIAKKFNHDFNCNFFIIPEKIITKHSSRIMSLRDASKKMSKSEQSDYSRINLIDSIDDIANKIKKAKTDEFTFPETIENAENRPEINNLINIYMSFSNKNKQDIINFYSNKKLSEFKKDLTELLIEKICPIGVKIKKLMSDKSYLLEIARKGNIVAKNIASKNIQEIKSIIGLTK